MANDRRVEITDTLLGPSSVEVLGEFQIEQVAISVAAAVANKHTYSAT